MTVGAQVWYKNDTDNNVAAVIGCLVVENEDNVWDDKIPTFSKIAIKSVFPDFDGSTYWDFMVFALTYDNEYVNDITESIETTDTSIAFDFGDGDYFIFSKDGDYFIITISLSISNEWISFVTNDADVSYVLNQTMLFMGTFLAIFAGFAPSSSGVIDVPAASAASEPAGDDTTTADVGAFTSSIGDIYGSGIPGFATPSVILSMIGGFALIYRKKFRK